MGRTGFLRKWSGTLLAGLMALALLVPTIDSFICIADIGQPTQVASAQNVQTAKQFPAQPQQDQDDVDPLCPHGHCHHWVGVTRLAERVDLKPSAKILEPVRGDYDSPPSAPRTELLRPPRA